MKYAVVTFGCRVNQADSLGHRERAAARGAPRGASPDDADVVIVNTCSVTAAADQGARQTIRRVARTNPDVRGRRDRLLRDAPARRARGAAERRRASCANADKDRLVSRCCSVRRAGGSDHRGALRWWRRGVRRYAGCLALGGRTALTLRVQTGCDERCSYCIIPQTRGAAVRGLSTAVVARHSDRRSPPATRRSCSPACTSGSYGRDLRRALVAARARAHGSRVARRRAVSNQLARADGLHAGDRRPRRRLAAARAALPSAASARLRCDARGDAPAVYGGRTIDAARRPAFARCMPDASIGSDIIVGFPGETDAHFDEMRRMLERAAADASARVSVLGSARDGGELRWPDKVDGAAIRARGRRFARSAHEMTRRFRRSQVGAHESAR